MEEKCKQNKIASHASLEIHTALLLERERERERKEIFSKRKKREKIHESFSERYTERERERKEFFFKEKEKRKDT